VLEEAYQEALKYLDRSEVNGVFKSRRHRNGKWTDDEECIQFHVKQKKSKSQLTDDEMLPAEILGVPTDVITANPVPSVANKQSAIQGGLSISIEEKEDGGTLGVILHLMNGDTIGLTNAHVLLKKYPNPNTPTLGSYAIHPSITDGAVIGYNRVGVPTQYILNTSGDAAIFTVDYPYGLSQFDTDMIITGIIDGYPGLNTVLKKLGRTTGITEGKVSGEGSVAPDYSSWGAGFVPINSFFLIPVDDGGGEIFAPGDSGSLWFKESTRDGVGLGYAHELGQTLCYACYLGACLSSLGASPLLSVTHETDTKGSVNVCINYDREVKGSLNIGGASKPFLTRMTKVKQTGEYEPIEDIYTRSGISWI
jgi:hypothetical protein